MNRWILKASVLFLAGNLALACGDDEDDGNTGTGGSAGKGGSGGSAGEGEGGTPESGSGGGGGAPEPVTCAAPTPPDVGSGEGGAGGGDAVGGGGGTASVSEGLAIVGSYTDDFDGEHTITNATWTSGGSVYNISQFDNEANYVIARNDEGNEYSPCAWSRFDWTESEGDIYFCQSAFAAESEDAALETEPADAEDLEEGCSGFPWSKLSAQ
jgi:hypothetical protein